MKVVIFHSYVSLPEGRNHEVHEKQPEVSGNRGTPSHHPYFNGIFHQKPSSYGTPMASETRCLCCSLSAELREALGWVASGSTGATRQGHGGTMALALCQKEVILLREQKWSVEQVGESQVPGSKSFTLPTMWYTSRVDTHKNLRPSTNSPKDFQYKSSFVQQCCHAQCVFLATRLVQE